MKKYLIVPFAVLLFAGCAAYMQPHSKSYVKEVHESFAVASAQSLDDSICFGVRLEIGLGVTAKVIPRNENFRVVIGFAPSTAEILGPSRSVLDSIVVFLSEEMESRYIVGGHTDFVGSAVYNAELSRVRAEAVKKYIVDHGIAELRLKARGYGEQCPTASNRTPEGRKENRRIEFYLVRQP